MASAPADAFRLLLSHTPDNIQWARRHKIDLMLAGHNHGGQIRLPLFGPVYSPSVYGAHYASGAFWESPTLMYVSRGISGKVPLRWNCLPELSRLTLRSALGTQTAATVAGAVAVDAK
jgi:predicted MPP superfamily phosphohydrolase